MMTDRQKLALKHIMADVERFSSKMLGIVLWPYQVDPLREILQSIFRKEGREFLIVFPRQSGKNEAIAVLLVYLLALFQRTGGAMVFAAIGDGLGRGVRRLEERLDNEWMRGKWRKSGRPIARWFGRAYVAFISSHTGARSRGETAEHLIVVDELQDQDRFHIESVIEPMRAANNATAVYIGTARFKHDALWLKKTEFEQAEAADGIRRVWLASPDEVAIHNPAYGRFVERKVAQYGRNHPIVASEYFCEPIDGDGGLFDDRRRLLMQGEHLPLTAPTPNETYCATLDVGGEDEGGSDPLTALANPMRDYAVLTIFRVVPNVRHVTRPTYEAVAVYLWQGRKFFSADGGGGLAEEIAALYNTWGAVHLIGDNTGVGAGLCSWLAAELGEGQVTKFTFSRVSKAGLGSAFLALVESGRFKYFQDGRGDGGDTWWFEQQAKHCAYTVSAGGQFEKDLQWGVPATAKIATPSGGQLVHDDRLLSAALIARADELQAEGKIVLARRTLLYW
ncbi:MAG: hypothetical protein OT477_14875 [Chloroflexi bacterium]|nr:hypothetical protein [Chloroflexota bacterium]